MNLRTSCGAIVLKGGLSLAGLLSATALISTPASAQQAYATGASSFTTPSGFVSSVSGEIHLPDGYYFTGPLRVTPSFSQFGGSITTVGTLIIDPGIAAPVPENSTVSSFKEEAAAALNAARTGSNSFGVSQIEAVTSIIRAGGDKGLE